MSKRIREFGDGDWVVKWHSRRFNDIRHERYTTESEANRVAESLRVCCTSTQSNIGLRKKYTRVEVFHNPQQ